MTILLTCMKQATVLFIKLLLCSAIGNFMIGNSRTWIGLTRNGNGFAWIDGTVGENLFWYRGEPNNRNEKCVEWMGGSWGHVLNDMLCYASRTALCEKKL